MRPALGRCAAFILLLAAGCLSAAAASDAQNDTAAAFPAPTADEPTANASDSSGESIQPSPVEQPDVILPRECESRVLDRQIAPPQWATGARASTLEAARALAERGPRADASYAGALARSLLQKHTTRGPRATVLAVALAVPQTRLALLMFRAGSQQMEANSSSASRYWRELGAAWNRSAVGVTGGAAGQWGKPFLDCGPLPGRWLLPYSVAAATRQYKAVAGIFVSADLDQCDYAVADMFGGAHKCHQETTECIPDLSWSPRRGRYTCECRVGHYLPTGPLSFPGFLVESSPAGEYKCLPCSGRCDRCDSSGQCLAEGDAVIRAIVLAVQSCCLFFVFVLASLVFYNRKCKTIVSGMWTLLETILLGIFLLYSTILIRFLPISAERCLVEPWCRELGFVLCYGAIVLKLYRHLIEFRTRNTHLCVVPEKDLLKYLSAMVVAALCYLAAFTASSLDYMEHQSIVEVGSTIDGLKFSTCKPLRWDLVTQAVEMLILAIGIHLSYASRNADTQFQERQFLCAAICVETAVSGSFYLLRDIYFEIAMLHPDLVILAHFLRSQLTCTIVLLLIFMPKLVFQRRQQRKETSCRHSNAFKTPSEMYDSDAGEVSTTDMNPDDIRAEFRRLYTQLEILRTKALRADISKRRAGCKAAHRRFSLQKSFN